VQGDGVGVPNSYLRPIDFVYHSTLGLRVIKKRRRVYQAHLVLSVELRGHLVALLLLTPASRVAIRVYEGRCKATWKTRKVDVRLPGKGNSTPMTRGRST